MNTKLHAITDANSRPVRFFITAGRISGYTSAAAYTRRPPGAMMGCVDGRRGHNRILFLMRISLTDPLAIAEIEIAPGYDPE